MKRSNYYRNTVRISGIDPGALWCRNELDMMILVDDDQFVSVPWFAINFEPDPYTPPNNHEVNQHDIDEMT